MNVLKITVKSFDYNELSDKAKERAYSDWLAWQSGDAWDAEYRKTLAELEKRLRFKTRDWSVEASGNYFRFRVNDDIPGVFSSPVRLARFIIRQSEIQSIEALDNCPFTGFCGDFGATDVIKKAFTFDLSSASLEEFIDDMLESFFNAWQEDKAGQLEKEYFEEAYAYQNTYLASGEACSFKDEEEL